MSVADKSAELLASWFGCGRSPIAPGTAGSLGAVPLHLLLRSLGPVPYWTATALITALGIWASDRVCKSSGEKDPQWIVIDEVAGTLIAMGLVRRRSLAVRLAALVVFRVLDGPGAADRVTTWTFRNGEIVDSSYESRPAPWREMREAPYDSSWIMRATCPYAMMADLNRGEITPVRALASPKYTVEGRKTLLLQMMRPLNMWNEIAASVEVRYDHDEA